MYREGILIFWSLASILNCMVYVSQQSTQKAREQLGILYQSSMPRKYFITLATVAGLHLPTYGVCMQNNKNFINSLERVQNVELKASTKNWSSRCEFLLQLCNLPTLACRRHYLKLCLLLCSFKRTVSCHTLNTQSST